MFLLTQLTRSMARLLVLKTPAVPILSAPLKRLSLLDSDLPLEVLDVIRSQWSLLELSNLRLTTS